MLTGIRFKHALTLIGLMAALAVVPMTTLAAVDFSVEVTGPQMAALSGLTYAEPDGVAPTSNTATTRIYFADSEGGADHVVRWDGSSLSVFATTAQLDAVGGAYASFMDMTCDSNGVLYIVLSGQGYQEIIWRVPGDNFTNAVQMMADPDVDEASEIAVDETNTRLIVAYSDIFGTPGPAFGEGIGWIALNATNATVNQLATEAELQAVVNAIPSSTSGDVDPVDVAVQSDGTVLVSHGFTSTLEENGSILKIASGGGVTLFASAATLITAAGADPATIDIGSVHLDVLSDDGVLAHVAFSSDDVTMEPFIALGSADGTSWQVLATESQVLADTDLAGYPLTDIGNALDGKHGGIDGNDNYWFHLQDRDNSDVDENVIVKMTGISGVPTPTPPPSADADIYWSLYQ